MQSNVCIHTVVHECIFTILTRAELRAVEQCFSSVQALNLEKLARHCYIRQPTPIPFPTDGDGFRFIKHPRQIRQNPKLAIAETPINHLAFLQHLSVWTCKAALLQFHYAAGKVNPENKSFGM